MVGNLLGTANGIPSHDTFERTFARLRPEQLQQCFLNWVQAVFHLTGGQLINLDGKTLRGSYDRGGKQGMIHRVSAWASQHRRVWGQRKVNEKSNQITAIPELLKVLDLIGCVESQRQVGDKITLEKRYYLLSLPLPLDAARFATAVRGHWSIENQLHWILAVSSREDQSRVKQGYSAENSAVIRHLAVNLLSQDQSAKGGTRAKRLRAGWDDQYLTKILASVPTRAGKL